MPKDTANSTKAYPCCNLQPLWYRYNFIKDSVLVLKNTLPVRKIIWEKLGHEPRQTWHLFHLSLLLEQLSMLHDLSSLHNNYQISLEQNKESEGWRLPIVFTKDILTMQDQLRVLQNILTTLSWFSLVTLLHCLLCS